MVLSVCHPDVNTTPELREPPSYKLSAIICNDGIHDTIQIYDLVDEFNSLGCCYCINGLSHDPFDELVDGHKEVVVAPECGL